MDDIEICRWTTAYMAKKLGIDFGELFGAAWEGLLDARTKFDDSKGMSWKSYANLRMKGAIVDYLRLSSGSRTVKRNHLALLSLNAPVSNAVDAELINFIEDNYTTYQMEQLELLEELDAISERYRFSVRETELLGYLKNGLRLRDAALRMNLTESRCSQLFQSMKKKVQNAGTI